MTKKAEPGPEDDDPPEEDEGKQSYEPGPYDDDPPAEKRSRVSSLLRSWWCVLVGFFYRS